MTKSIHKKLNQTKINSHSQSIAPARIWALKLFDAVMTEGKTLNEVLPQLESAGLAENDFRLAREIISGTCRYWGKCRFALNQFASNLEKLPTIIQRILELSTYQLFYLDRIPDYAVLNDAVELSRRNRFSKLTGVVNGILRNLERNMHSIKWPDSKDHFAYAIAIEHSHPQWLVEEWCKRWGNQKTEELCRYNNTRAPLSLRIRGDFDKAIQELTTQNVAFQIDNRFQNRVDISPDCTLDSVFFQNPNWVAQDGASMLVVDLLNPQPGWRVWDTCAAPGGKSFYIADRMNQEGEILASDKSANRLQALIDQKQFLKDEFIQTQVIDLQAKNLSLDLGEFDAILVDAPCSGWGTFRRHPDLRWRIRPEDPKRLAKLALQLLDRAQKYLKSGGILVYSTCTLSAEENENVVTQFLNLHPNYEIEPAASFLPNTFQCAETKQKSFGLFPSDWNLDGSFGVRLRKAGGTR